MNIPYQTTIAFELAIPKSDTPTIVVNRAWSKLNEVLCVFADKSNLLTTESMRTHQTITYSQ